MVRHSSERDRRIDSHGGHLLAGRGVNADSFTDCLGARGREKLIEICVTGETALRKAVVRIGLLISGTIGISAQRIVDIIFTANDRPCFSPAAAV